LLCVEISRHFLALIERCIERLTRTARQWISTANGGERDSSKKPIAAPAQINFSNATLYSSMHTVRPWQSHTLSAYVLDFLAIQAAQDGGYGWSIHQGEKMKAPKRINKKNQKGLLMFCLVACFSVSPSFAQSQGTPTGQQTQQAPPPTTNLTPSDIRVDVGGAHNGSIYTNKFPDFTNKFPGSTLALPQGRRAQDVASRRRFAEAGAETPAQAPDKQAEAGAKTPAQSPDKQSDSQESVARPTFTYGAEMDFNSDYVWRGLLLDDGPVWQPSAWISAFGFTFTAWGNVAMTSASEDAGLESGGAGLKSGGLTLTYNHDWEKLRMEAALDAYTGRQLPDIEARNTMEGSLKLSYPAGPLRIFTIHAFDVLAYRGSYFGEAGLEYGRQVTKSTEFTISARSGWASAKFNDVYIGVDKSAFNFVGVEGALTYYLGRHMYFQPHIEFSAITDGRLREELAPANIVNYGLAVVFRK
jgi:hypothetical protein